MAGPHLRDDSIGLLPFPFRLKRARPRRLTGAIRFRFRPIRPATLEV